MLEYTCLKERIALDRVVAARILDALRGPGRNRLMNERWTIHGHEVRFGDIVSYNVSWGAPMLRHEAIAVAPGTVVSFTRLNEGECTCASMTPRGSHVSARSSGWMRIQRIDDGYNREKLWRVERGRTASSRVCAETRVTRALRSLGSFHYDMVRQNCQHLISVICETPGYNSALHGSPGTLFMALFGVGIGLIVLVLCSVWLQPGVKSIRTKA